MQKRTLDLILIGLLIALAVLLYSSTASYLEYAQKTTGKYVRFLAISLGVCSVIQLFLTLKGNEFKKKIQWMALPGRFFGLFALLVVYAIILTKLGFFSSSALFIPIAALLLGYRNLTFIILTTGLTLTFLYLVFVLTLGVPLPEGILL